MRVCECRPAARRARVDNVHRCATCGGWIGRTRAGNHDQIHTRLVHLRRIADQLDDGYRWAYNTVHERSVGERLEGRSSTVSNPTATLVAEDDPRRARTLLAVADQLVDRATRALLDAAAAVGAALELIEPSRSDEHTPAAFHDPESFPTVARRSEIAHATAAQRRRTARGEGWGQA